MLIALCAVWIRFFRMHFVDDVDVRFVHLFLAALGGMDRSVKHFGDLWR